jgi:hypothetical protein
MGLATGREKGVVKRGWNATISTRSKVHIFSIDAQIAVAGSWISPVLVAH